MDSNNSKTWNSSRVDDHAVKAAMSANINVVLGKKSDETVLLGILFS